MARHLTACITTSALLLVGAARGWAGLGDIDPNFGSAGSLQPGNGILLVLPDDRLVFAQEYNFLVAGFDANGKVDPTFGDGGQAGVPLPEAIQRFNVIYAANASDGGLLVAGFLRDPDLTQVFEAVVRLDRNGRLVTSFGGHRDGFYRLTDTPVQTLDGVIPATLMAIAVDASGRILLAERSWTADGRCGGPTSVVRLTPGGTRDPAFGTNGRADAPGVDLCGAVALFGARQDGSIVVGARGEIVGLDAGGALDPTFGVGGHVSHGRPDDWARGVLLPDGRTLIVERDSATTASNAAITKFDRRGELDATFGAGTGSVQIDFSAAFFGISDSRQLIHDVMFAPDAAHIYLKLEVLHPDGSTACAGGIARVSLDGMPDLSFGRNGLTCLDYGAFPFFLVGSQRNGGLLFGQWLGSLYLYRLLVDATESPGMVMLRSAPSTGVREADGTMTMPVVRTAGHDGAVSVSFSTGPRLPDPDDGNGSIVSYAASEGSDFLAASGQLDWADGDDAEREITVTIVDDEIDDENEHFSIRISDPQGGALADGQPIDVGIADDDEAPPPTDPPPTGPPVSGGSGGGGGALSWPTLLLLSGLLLGPQRRRHFLIAGRSATRIDPTPPRKHQAWFDQKLSDA